jgi:hypothetical protein
MTLGGPDVGVLTTKVVMGVMPTEEVVMGVMPTEEVVMGVMPTEEVVMGVMPTEEVAVAVLATEVAVVVLATAALVGVGQQEEHDGQVAHAVSGAFRPSRTESSGLRSLF